MPVTATEMKTFKLTFLKRLWLVTNQMTSPARAFSIPKTRDISAQVV